MGEWSNIFVPAEPADAPSSWADIFTVEEEQRTAEEELRRIEEERQAELARAQEEQPANQRSGEGVGGILGDVAAGAAGGAIRAAEAINRTAQWFAPGDASALGEGAKYWQGIREANPDLFGESRASEKAREGSAWNPRGWLHGGFESLTMMTPGLAVGAVSGGAGIAVTATQFWGDTAQKYYDDAVANEAKGIGEKLSEGEKVAYANLRGFVEGGLEAVQQYIPFGKLGKVLPKTKVDNIIRGAVLGVEGGVGKKALASAKGIVKTIAAESAMEVGQEYGGQKIDFISGQSQVDPSWDTVKGVIGPTIIMSTILGFAGQAQESSNRKALHDALTSPNVAPEHRDAAVNAVYETVKGQDAELAELWKAQTLDNLRQNKPVALPIDSEVRAQAKETPAPTTVAEVKENLQAEVAELRAQVEAKSARADQDIAVQQEVQKTATLVKSLESLVKGQPKSPFLAIRQQKLAEAQSRLAELTGAATDQATTLSPDEGTLSPDETAESPQAGELPTPEPVVTTTVDEAAHATSAESPLNDLPGATDGQKSAGNYAMGHTKIAGLPISIENPQGSVRRGVDETGREWETPLTAHYGYVRGTTANDGGKFDVFVKPGTEETFDGPVYVVNQYTPAGIFDEHKAVIGTATIDEANALYDSNYEAGWQGRGETIQMTMDEFKVWSKDGDLSAPAMAQVAPATTAPQVENTAPVAEPSELPEADVTEIVTYRDICTKLLLCVKGN